MSGITGCFENLLNKLDCRDRLMSQFTDDRVALAMKVGKIAFIIIACLAVGFAVASHPIICGLSATLSISLLVLSEKEKIPLAKAGVISTREWAAARRLDLTFHHPYPQALQEFLLQPCTSCLDKTNAEMHIVVPLFPEVFIKGSEPTSLTLKSLHQLAGSAGGPGFSDVWSKIPEDQPIKQAFRYGVLTRDVIPGSRNKSRDEQEKLLFENGYELPSFLDAALAVFWDNQLSGSRCLGYNPMTYTRCKEIIEGQSLLVGRFTPAGLRVCNDLGDKGVSESIGASGWREF